MAQQRLQPGQPGYRCPPSEHDPHPSASKTAYQRFRSHAAEHKDDGVRTPLMSDDPPRHSR
jgi:hypothetical protein